ncbi:MAG: UDP-N-acetylmuramate--L-alanine ligase, partial [Acidimicrobiia bacterium]
MADGVALADWHRIHVVGVGGAGMSALARLLTGRGHVVTGSDARTSTLLEALSREGIETWAGHRTDRLEGVDLVVASSAVPPSDAEVADARRRAIPVWNRPELLAALTSEIPTVGATGTHGKTSTTAMLIVAAKAAGLDPSFVVGGEVRDLGTNAGSGDDDLLILEVDEAFGTFEHVRLESLVVTNVEADHLDHFGTLAEVEAAFERVVRAVSGEVFCCVDDAGSHRLGQRTGAIGYGTGADAVWRAVDVDAGAEGSRFRLVSPLGAWDVVLPRPGIHMVRNAVGAIALVGSRGGDVEAAIGGLGSFQGVGRRWDVRGEVGGITVVDDYAHHPTEVSATLAAAFGSGRRVVAVFQPHLYSRTAEHAEDFGSALARAAAVVVLDVYGAREEPMPGVDGTLV